MPIEEVCKLVITAALGSTGLFALLTTILQRHWKKQDDKERHMYASSEDQMKIMHMCVALCRNEIVNLCEKYCDRGWVRERELTNLIDIYMPYHAAGGNDVASSMIEQVKRLPLHANDYTGEPSGKENS